MSQITSKLSHKLWMEASVFLCQRWWVFANTRWESTSRANRPTTHHPSPEIYLYLIFLLFLLSAIWKPRLSCLYQERRYTPNSTTGAPVIPIEEAWIFKFQTLYQAPLRSSGLYPQALSPMTITGNYRLCNSSSTISSTKASIPSHTNLSLTASTVNI